MLSRRWYLVFLSLALFWNLCAASPIPLQALEPKFDSLIELSQQAPAKALSQIEYQLTQSTEPLQQAQLLFVQAQVQNLLVYPEDALTSVQQALTLIQQQQQPWLYHSLQLVGAFALDLAGTPAEGMAATEAALHFANQQQHQSLYLQALVTRGALHLSLVNYVESLHDLLQAYHQAPLDDPILSKGHIAGYIALVYEYRHEYELAIPYFEEAVAFHQSRNSPVEVSIALYGLGKAHSKLGDFATGQRKLQQSLDLSKAADDDQGVAYARKELATIAMQQHKMEQARSLLLQALSSFEQANNRYMLLDSHLQLAKIALHSADLAAAELALQQATEYADPKHMPIQHAEVQRLQADWLALSGQSEEAYQLLKSASQRLAALQREESTQLLHQLRAQHELDSRTLENNLLQKELELQHSRLHHQERQQRLLTLLLAVAIAGSLLLLWLLTRILWQRKELRRLANYDSLTNLPNRRYTLQLLEQQLKLASRYQYPLTLAMLDLDYFKQINDGYGHATGDQLLRDFAQLCQNRVRSTDVVGRIGGEEFLALFPHTNATDAAAVLEVIRQETELLGKRYDKENIRTTVSIGYAAFSQYDNAESLLLHVDKALYRAKSQGRNQLVESQD